MSTARPSWAAVVAGVPRPKNPQIGCFRAFSVVPRWAQPSWASRGPDVRGGKPGVAAELDRSPAGCGIGLHVVAQANAKPAGAGQRPLEPGGEYADGGGRADRAVADWRRFLAQGGDDGTDRRIFAVRGSAVELPRSAEQNSRCRAACSNSTAARRLPAAAHHQLADRIAATEGSPYLSLQSD